MCLQHRPLPSLNGPQRPVQSHSAMSADASIARSVASSTSSPRFTGSRMYRKFSSEKQKRRFASRRSACTAVPSASGGRLASDCVVLRSLRKERRSGASSGDTVRQASEAGGGDGARRARAAAPGAGGRWGASAHPSLSLPSWS